MRRSVRTTLLVGSCALVLPALAGVVLERRAESQWADLHARLDRVQAELPGGCRPVLRGEPLAGEAFARYGQACRLALREHLHGGVLPHATLADLAREDEERRLQRLAFVERARPVVELIGSGARSRRASIAVDWEAEEHEWPRASTPVRFAHGDPDRDGCAIFLAGHDLPRLGFQVFLSELHEGRTDAALDLLLDLLQLARDLAASPLPYESSRGAALLVPGELLAFGEQGGWSRFSAPQLHRLVDALGTVDEELDALGTSPRVQVVLEARCLEAFLFRGATWSERLVKLLATPLTARTSRQARDTYLLVLDYVRERELAFAADPLAAPARLREAWLERVASGAFRAAHPRADAEKVADAIAEIDHRGEQRLAGLARLRLLRNALAALSGRDDAPAVDRSGAAIRSELRDGVLRTFLTEGPGAGLEVRVPAPAPPR